MFYRKNDIKHPESKVKDVLLKDAIDHKFIIDTGEWVGEWTIKRVLMAVGVNGEATHPTYLIRHCDGQNASMIIADGNVYITTLTNGRVLITKPSKLGFIKVNSFYAIKVKTVVSKGVIGGLPLRVGDEIAGYVVKTITDKYMIVENFDGEPIMVRDRDSGKFALYVDEETRKRHYIVSRYIC